MFSVVYYKPQSKNTFENQRNVFLFFVQVMMTYLFTSESVAAGHPDKVADQISDAILDAYLAQDPNSKVACETLVTTNKVVIAWEVRSTATVDVEKVARDTIKKIWYIKSEYWFDADSCDIEILLHEQSADIARGVDRETAQEQWAWDQGMMFGYACNETENYMPLPLDLAHKILIELNEIRQKWKEMPYLRPDAKSQVTVEYSDEWKPIRINTIVVSTQHDEFLTPENWKSQLETDEMMLNQIYNDVKNIVLPRVKSKLSENLQKLFDENLILYVNPTGKFVIGWPNGDTGLTWRKIIVDTYGWKWAHWGWAFSGKDPSKVDRSAAYAARHIAKNLVAAGISDEILVQVAYAIWVAKPVSLYINTYWKSKVNLSDSEIAKKVETIFDMRPNAIENRLKLRNPIYFQTASYGHMWRTPNNNSEVELFTREKLDYIDQIKKEFWL